MVVKTMFVSSTRCKMEEFEMNCGWRTLSSGLVDCGMFERCFAKVSGDCSDVKIVVAVEAMKVSCVTVAELGNESTKNYFDSGTQSFHSM